jgi:hypothetical protein
MIIDLNHQVQIRNLKSHRRLVRVESEAVPLQRLIIQSDRVEIYALERLIMTRINLAHPSYSEYVQ